MLWLTALAALTLLIWLFQLFARGAFWREPYHVLAAGSPATTLRIAVILPARNESAVIEKCLRSLLDQDYAGPVHIFLVDDASTDATASIAQRIADAHPGRLTIIPSTPLPEGWTGKNWAMHQAVQRVRDFRPDLLFFMDADIAAAPGALSAVVTNAEAGRYDLASCIVRLHCGNAAERFVVPAFVFFFFMLYPPRWVLDRRRPTAGAAGGCVLVRPDALERAGGFEAIRHEVIDDCALARAVKRTGGTIWLGLTDLFDSIRPYGLLELERMIARTAFNQLRHSTAVLIASMLGLLITFVAPVGLLFSGYPLPIALAGAAWFLMTLAYLPMVVFYDASPLWALTLPFTAIFYFVATVDSAIKYWTGRGGQWKGRAQDRIKPTEI